MAIKMRHNHDKDAMRYVMNVVIKETKYLKCLMYV